MRRKETVGENWTEYFKKREELLGKTTYLEQAYWISATGRYVWLL